MATPEDGSDTDTILFINNSQWQGNIAQKADSISLYLSDTQFTGNIKSAAVNFNTTILSSIFNGDINYQASNNLKPDYSFGLSIQNNAVVNSHISIANAERVSLVIDSFSTLNGDITMSSDTATFQHGNFEVMNESHWNGKLDLSQLNNIPTTEGEPTNTTIFLNSGSVWTGHIVDGANKNVRLLLNGNSKATRWDITGDTRLALLQNNDTDSAVPINFINSHPSIASIIFHTLTTDVLESKFDLNMRVGATGAERDQLVIKDSAQGDVSILVMNNPGAKISGLQTYQMVDATNANTDEASFTFTNTDMKLELGGFVYDMVTTDLPEGSFIIDAPVMSSGTSIGLSSVAVGYMMNDLAVHSLQQRMGDLRNTAGLDNNVWVKSYSGKFESKENQGVRGFDLNYNAIQGGIDRKIASNENSRVHAGIMLGYNDANADYHIDGKGKAKQLNTGVYATYINDNGVYVDGTLNYGRLKQAVDANLQSGGSQSASAAKNVYSASVEAGKRIFADASKQGLYVEPQVQLAVSHNDEMKFDTDKDLTVDIDDYTSIQSRAGVQIGYEFGKEILVNLYVKSQWVHDFSSDVDYKLNDIKGTYKLKGDRWINSVGASATIAKQHQIYTDVSYEDSRQFNHLQGQVGYRFNF